MFQYSFALSQNAMSGGVLWCKVRGCHLKSGALTP